MSNAPISPPRIVFLNQVAGPLFRELAEDVACELGPCLLLSGHVDQLARPTGSKLNLVAAPDYERRSLFSRAWSWIRYFCVAARLTWRSGPEPLLFIVSNPPFLGLLGYFLRMVRGQRYVVLVYDIYPELLVRLGRMKARGLGARIWSLLNRRVWGGAEIVFTIGNHMAKNLANMIPAESRKKLVVIPNWADGSFIKPLPKEQNWFAHQHRQTECLTVMYSGNLGNTHDLAPLLRAAAHFRGDAGLAFLIVGSGARWNEVEEHVRREQLTNVTLLPLQPEKDLPWSLATADVAVITLEKGIEGLSVPSKTAYAMASGAALLGIVNRPSEVAETIERHQCGLCVDPKDLEGVFIAIQRFRSDPKFLLECRRRARAGMEMDFGRSNTGRYVECLKPLCAATTPQPVP